MNQAPLVALSALAVTLATLEVPALAAGRVLHRQSTTFGFLTAAIGDQTVRHDFPDGLYFKFSTSGLSTPTACQLLVLGNEPLKAEILVPNPNGNGSISFTNSFYSSRSFSQEDGQATRVVTFEFPDKYLAQGEYTLHVSTSSGKPLPVIGTIASEGATYPLSYTSIEGKLAPVEKFYAGLEFDIGTLVTGSTNTPAVQITRVGTIEVDGPDSFSISVGYPPEFRGYQLEVSTDLKTWTPADSVPAEMQYLGGGMWRPIEQGSAERKFFRISESPDKFTEILNPL